jgi:hypothetical protein
MQPFRSKNSSPAECWSFFERYSVELTGFRDRFAQWLAASYDNPDRYLETIPDRYVAGIPDRLDPSELLEHNGERGRERYDGDCADRRAWTWEVRIAGELPLTSVRALHVPFDILPLAGSLALEMESTSGISPEIKTLPADVPADFNTLYEDSGRVMKELIG